MKYAALLLICLAMTVHVLGYPGAPKFAVYVFDCQDRYIAIWADSRRTIPLANPFYTDDPKHIEFFTSVSCISVNVKAVR